MSNSFVKNLDRVIEDVEKARIKNSEHHIVDIVAISKYSTTNDIKELFDAGQQSFGENKIQDLKLKSKELKELPIRWHFVGKLQKNKINNLIEIKPALFHSLDSLSLAYDLNKKLFEKNKTINCLLQINSSYEQSKSGVNPQEAVAIYKDIEKNCPNIKLKGIMCMAPNSDDENIVKKSFKISKEIYDKLEDATILSMGMSGDFQTAISCGSNMIRIGSKLFSKVGQN